MPIALAFFDVIIETEIEKIVLALKHSRRIEYGMFEHFRRFPWVLEPFLYDDQDALLAALTERVIGPAEAFLRKAK